MDAPLQVKNPPSTISLVITARNRRDETLRALRSGTDVETLVILDATEDDSEPEIRSRHPHVRVIANDVHRGPLAQHNRGAMETSGEVIVWLDDDAELRSPATISETLRQFATRESERSASPTSSRAAARGSSSRHRAVTANG